MTVASPPFPFRFAPMLPLVWLLGVGLATVVGLLTALNLLASRMKETLARLRDEVLKDASRIQGKAAAADDKLADQVIGSTDLAVAVREWQTAVTTDGLVKVGGARWDWDDADVGTWAEREVETRKVQLAAGHARNQAVAWGVGLFAGLVLAVAGYFVLSAGYLNGQ